MIDIQAIDGVHEPRLVARVEEVTPMIHGLREIHEHDAAFLVVKAEPAGTVEQLHGGADQVGRVVSWIGQPHARTLAV